MKKAISKPKIPLVLIWIGAIIQILTSLIYIFGGSAFSNSNAVIIGMVLLFISLIYIVGGFKTYSIDKKQIKFWAIVIIVLAIVSFILSATLAWLSSLLVGIAAIIALSKSGMKI